MGAAYKVRALQPSYEELASAVASGHFGRRSRLRGHLPLVVGQRKRVDLPPTTAAYPVRGGSGGLGPPAAKAHGDVLSQALRLGQRSGAARAVVLIAHRPLRHTRRWPEATIATQAREEG
jgi:hypothetical protein